MQCPGNVESTFWRNGRPLPMGAGAGPVCRHGWRLHKHDRALSLCSVSGAGPRQCVSLAVADPCWLSRPGAACGLPDWLGWTDPVWPACGADCCLLPVVEDPRKPGYYAGWLTAAMQLGRLFTSVYWGKFSDRRAAARPVLGHGVHRCYASSALVAIMVHAAVAPAAVRRGQPAVNERTRLYYSSHHAIRKSPWP